MSDLIHVKVSNETTLTLPISIGKILKNREIPEELDIVIIEKNSEESVERVLGCFDFNDDLLEKANRLKIEQWLED
ncbi:MAG: hypothetical protein HXS40_04590 [Theionarchaea archaeon]|nr:hypothetical protein [Theionarchaea archaeon]